MWQRKRCGAPRRTVHLAKRSCGCSRGPPDGLLPSGSPVRQRKAAATRLQLPCPFPSLLYGTESERLRRAIRRLLLAFAACCVSLTPTVVHCGVTGSARAPHAVTARGRDKLRRCAFVRLRLGSERLWSTRRRSLCASNFCCRCVQARPPCFQGGCMAVSLLAARPLRACGAAPLRTRATRTPRRAAMAARSALSTDDVCLEAARAFLGKDAQVTFAPTSGGEAFVLGAKHSLCTPVRVTDASARRREQRGAVRDVRRPAPRAARV
jgi:hypothetical protein